MKIQDLLEFQSAQPVLAYHTTTRPHLKSILKQGLVPNKSKGGYGSDLQSASGYNMAALPGTYFYKDYRQTKNLANDVNAKSGEDAAIIICQVQPKTATLDEDNLVASFGETGLIRNFKKLAQAGKLDNEAIDSAVKNIVDHQLYSIKDQRLIDAATPSIRDYVVAIAKFASNQNPETEADLKKNQEILTNKLRRVAMTKEYRNSHDSFKINEPIGFSGANKIVGIYLPQHRVGWGQLGEFERDAYHTYDSPMKLVSKEKT